MPRSRQQGSQIEGAVLRDRVSILETDGYSPKKDCAYGSVEVSAFEMASAMARWAGFWPRSDSRCSHLQIILAICSRYCSCEGVCFLYYRRTWERKLSGFRRLRVLGGIEMAHSMNASRPIP